jgi:enoyl-CoA hydratase/carnithine racemase
MMEITDRGGIRVVNLGGATNAVDAAFLADLNDALDRVEADESATAMITIGGGKHYSNGFDLEFLGGLDYAEASAFLDDTATTLGRILAFRVPTVAVLNGHAFGAGAMAALAHDLRVQNTDRGWFCFPEVDLGMQFMPFQLALITSRLSVDTANEAVLTGKRYDGAASLAAGIVQATAGPESLIARAAELVAPWTGKVPANVAALKHQLNADTLGLLPPVPD